MAAGVIATDPTSETVLPPFFSEMSWAAKRVPAITPFTEFARNGGLLARPMRPRVSVRGSVNAREIPLCFGSTSVD